MGAAYHNDEYPACHGYNVAVHVDHRMVRETLINCDFNLREGQYTRAVSCDPRIDDENLMREDAMSRTQYRDMFSVANRSDQLSERRGFLQRIYGWLRGPSYWLYSETDGHCGDGLCGLFNRVVYHLRSH